MKRIHVHVSVTDLEASIRFYSELFAAGPSAQKPDCVKWMLDDPRVNFAVSQRGGKVGIQHLGIQSGKSWIEGRQGIQWEPFLASGESATYSHVRVKAVAAAAPLGACCAPSCYAPRTE